MILTGGGGYSTDCSLFESPGSDLLIGSRVVNGAILGGRHASIKNRVTTCFGDFSAMSTILTPNLALTRIIEWPDHTPISALQTVKGPLSAAPLEADEGSEFGISPPLKIGNSNQM